MLNIRTEAVYYLWHIKLKKMPPYPNPHKYLGKVETGKDSSSILSYSFDDDWYWPKEHPFILWLGWSCCCTLEGRTPISALPFILVAVTSSLVCNHRSAIKDLEAFLIAMTTSRSSLNIRDTDDWMDLQFASIRVFQRDIAERNTRSGELPQQKGGFSILSI